MPHPRPSWPRRLRRVCVFSVLGLVTTVGVAWGLAATPVDSAFRVSTPGLGGAGSANFGSPFFESESYLATGRVLRTWSSADNTIEYLRRSFRTPQMQRRPAQPVEENHWLSSWSVVGETDWGAVHDHHRRFMRGQVNVVGAEQAVGWPAIAMWCSVEYGAIPGYATDPSSPEAPPEPRAVGGIPYAPIVWPSEKSPAMPDMHRVPALPLLPIWPGLAFNTLFYAVLWWLALASVRTVKHNRRYRHGLCPLCRYDLRADYSQGCSECGWGRDLRR